MMIRKWLRAAATFALSSAFALTALHAAPYDDGGLAAVLHDPACPAPCFMGIRPGTTLFDEAVALLREHPWVGEVTADAGSVTWTWSGSQPPFLHIPPDDWAFTRIVARGGIVEFISFYTHAPAATYLLTLGTPDRSLSNQWQFTRTIGSPPFQSTAVAVSHEQMADFDALNLTVRLGVECPPKRENIWALPVLMLLGDNAVINPGKLTPRAFTRLPKECR
jgi:hypothetical protein